jgi:hypothetical protein
VTGPRFLLIDSLICISSVITGVGAYLGKKERRRANQIKKAIFWVNRCLYDLGSRDPLGKLQTRLIEDWKGKISICTGEELDTKTQLESAFGGYTVKYSTRVGDQHY